MRKFLHLADIHLGYQQYNSLERQRDFFHAFYDVIQRVAIPQQVDFCLIAGDLFDKRSVDPRTMNQAVAALTLLKEARIPVFAIEGNHDGRQYGESVTWVRFLAALDYLYLLEPVHEEGEIKLLPWDPAQKSGSYYELDGVRIIGSRWYGSTAGRMIAPLAEAIAALPPAPYTILLFHQGIEGFMKEQAGGITYEQLQPLRGLVNYLALGHIHKRYSIDDWVYNPGSLESCNVQEAEEQKGAFLVTLDEQYRHRVEAVTGYRCRPFQRLCFDLSRSRTPEQFQQELLGYVQAERKTFSMPPVVELVITGRCHFPRSEVDWNALKVEVQHLLTPLCLLLKIEAVPAELPVFPGTIGMDRRALEHRVLSDLLARDARYREDAEHWARVLLELKRRALQKEPAPELLAYLSQVKRGKG
ncbi:MAG: exonuclease SbcCD subunit D [Nitrospinota bacterium]|nr:MAG: exonuclease SbcCD subunit D [Nitrospinota bacterium]